MPIMKSAYDAVFLTGAKWSSIRQDGTGTRYLCCNGAEGEPGMSGHIRTLTILGKETTMERHEIVQASYDRCLADGDFFQTFYDIFLATTPEIAALFSQTDFSKQKNLIKATVGLMIRLDTGNANARRMIEKVGDTHSQNALDIRPELYDKWLDSLCDAVQKHDPDYNAELETSWRESMQPGIDLVTCHY